MSIAAVCQSILFIEWAFLILGWCAEGRFKCCLVGPKGRGAGGNSGVKSYSLTICLSSSIPSCWFSVHHLLLLPLSCTVGICTALNTTQCSWCQVVLFCVLCFWLTARQENNMSLTDYWIHKTLKCSKLTHAKSCSAVSTLASTKNMEQEIRGWERGHL